MHADSAARFFDPQTPSYKIVKSGFCQFSHTNHGKQCLHVCHFAKGHCHVGTGLVHLVLVKGGCKTIAAYKAILCNCVLPTS